MMLRCTLYFPDSCDVDDLCIDPVVIHAVIESVQKDQTPTAILVTAFGNYIVRDAKRDVIKRWLDARGEMQECA